MAAITRIGLVGTAEPFGAVTVEGQRLTEDGSPYLLISRLDNSEPRQTIQADQLP